MIGVHNVPKHQSPGLGQIGSFPHGFGGVPPGAHAHDEMEWLEKADSILPHIASYVLLG